MAGAVPRACHPRRLAARAAGAVIGIARSGCPGRLAVGGPWMALRRLVRPSLPGTPAVRATRTDSGPWGRPDRRRGWHAGPVPVTLRRIALPLTRLFNDEDRPARSRVADLRRDGPEAGRQERGRGAEDGLDRPGRRAGRGPLRAQISDVQQPRQPIGLGPLDTPGTVPDAADARA